MKKKALGQNTIQMTTSQDQTSKETLPSFISNQQPSLLFSEKFSCPSINMKRSCKSIFDHSGDTMKKVGNIPTGTSTSTSVSVAADRTSGTTQTQGSRITLCTTARRGTDHEKLNLLSSVSSRRSSTHVNGSTPQLKPSANARTITVGDVDSSSCNEDAAVSAGFEFVFPCLSLDVESTSLLPDDILSIAALLKRPISVRLENASTNQLQIQNLLTQSFPASQPLHKVFTYLIHRRLEYWIDTLRRAVSQEDQCSDSNNKRVLAALLDVQSSIYVHSDLKVKFRLDGNSGAGMDQSTNDADSNAEEIMKIEKELADALKTMRRGSTPTLVRSIQAEESQHNTHSTSRTPSQDIASSLLFPDIGCMDQKIHHVQPLTDDSDDDELMKKVTVPFCLDALAYVTAQIGDELEHNQSVVFQTSGAVTACYESSSLVRVELTINTQQLYSCLEKEARSVARSTAESVLLNAVTEQELSGNKTDSSSSDSHQSSTVALAKGFSKKCEHPALVTPRPTYPVPTSPKPYDNGYGVHSLVGAPPIAVSPITITMTPRRNTSTGISATPLSPIVSIRKLPLVSPPPAKNKRFKLPFQQQKHECNSTLGPYVPTFDTSSRDHLFSGKSIVEDVAGALTALKHSN